MIFKLFNKPQAKTGQTPKLPDTGPAVMALAKLAGGIDQRFVSIIEELMAYQRRSHELCGLSASLVEDLSAGGLNESMAEIGRTVSAIAQGQQSFGQVFNERIHLLEAVLGRLKTIESSLEETASQLKTLDMLGFMTRIEDARLTGSDFASLAAEVRELSRQIGQSQRQIAGQVAEVGQSLKSALVKLAGLDEHRRSQASAVQAGANSALAALEQHYGATLATLAGLKSASAELERDFTTMVIELQVNDIVRQKLEHVCAALGEIRPEHFYGVVELQCGQLSRTADELEAALKTCDAASRGVAGKVAGVVAALGELMQSDQGASRIRLALEAIAELSAGLSANQATQAEMDQTLASLWQAIEATSQHVATIRSIGFRMQLIALNSRIKAAHLGQDGRVLESISGAIYAISLTARDQTEHLASSIASLELAPATAAEALQTDLDLAATSRRLLAIEAELEPALEAIRHKSAGFGEGFERIRELLGAASAMPPAITAELAGLKDLLTGLEPPAADADLSELSERYTMQSERAVHAQQDEEPSAAALDDELGLNVELF